MRAAKVKERRVPRAQRIATCREYGVRYSGRQWVKLRKRIRRAVKAARLEAHHG